MLRHHSTVIQAVRIGGGEFLFFPTVTIVDVGIPLLLTVIL
jgi:hypothetical protein